MLGACTLCCQISIFNPEYHSSETGALLPPTSALGGARKREGERRRGRGGRPLFLFCGGVEKCGNIFRGLLSSSTTAAAAAFRFANILEGAAKSFQHSIGGASG